MPPRLRSFAFAASLLAAPLLASASSAVPEEPETGPVKIQFTFKEGGNRQMALTSDSVGVLPWDPSAGALEPDDEADGLEHTLGKRALSPAERDSAARLLGLTRTLKGNRRIECDGNDGYAFSLWSDSLTLHCRNCFSCTEGVGMSEAKNLARLGRLSLWLYRLGQDLEP